MIQDCYKNYSFNGMNKVMSPAETFMMVYKKLMSLKLLGGFEFRHDRGVAMCYPYVAVKTNNFLHPMGIDYVFGKGYTTEQACISGLMELAERYSCFKKIDGKEHDYNFPSRRVAGRGILLSSLNEILCENNDDLYPILKGFKDYDDFYTHWDAGYDIEGEKVLIPTKVLSRVFYGTNGMCSGNTVEEALLHGMCEVIERHHQTRVYNQKIILPEIDKRTITSPLIRDMLRKFADYNSGRVFLKDFSNGMGISVIGVVRESLGQFLVTVACAPSPEDAMLRALLEAIQINNPKNRVDEKGIQHLIRTKQKVSYEDLPDLSDRNIKNEIFKIEEILQSNEMKTYFVDCTDNELGIPCLQIYIKGAKFNKMAVMGDYHSARDNILAYLKSIETQLKTTV